MGDRKLISDIREDCRRLAHRQGQLEGLTHELVAQSQAAMRRSYALLARTYRQSRGGWDIEENRVGTRLEPVPCLVRQPT
jgi:hypothetical protein